MAELSIKISIAGRVYPLSIQSEEEEKVREAAKIIDELVKSFETKYAVKDKQDLLAMCALQFATQKLNTEDSQSDNSQETLSELKELEDYLADFLSKH